MFISLALWVAMAAQQTSEIQQPVAEYFGGSEHDQCPPHAICHPLPEPVAAQQTSMYQDAIQKQPQPVCEIRNGTSNCSGAIFVEMKRAEPMDVPAIQVWRSDDPRSLSHFQYWTCADKSRILLTAEDGFRHCLKLK